MDDTTGWTWQVRRDSVFGTIVPAVGALLGGGFLVLGLVSLARPWAGVPRVGFIPIAAIGLVALVDALWWFQFVARRIDQLPGGRFRLTSRRRELTIEPGDAVSLRAWLLINDVLQINPIRLRTTRGSVWICRQVDYGEILEGALCDANPELKVNRAWVPPPDTMSQRAADQAREGFPYG